MTIDATEPEDFEIQPPTAGEVITEEPEVKAESSPDSGESHEQKQNGVQKRFNELTAKRYEETRRADEAEKRLKELEASKPLPVVDTEAAPALPEDLYDDEAMRKYHTDTSAYNRKMAEAAGKSAYEQQQQAASKTAQESKRQAAVSSYVANAQRDGVDLEVLRAAEQSLNNAGIDPSLGAHIVADPNGAKIVEYLHNNPAEMHELLSLTPMSASIKIANDIKAKALSTTPKVSNAPEPLPIYRVAEHLRKMISRESSPALSSFKESQKWLTIIKITRTRNY